NEASVNNLSLKWTILLSETIPCVAAVIMTTIVNVRSGLATTEATIVEDTRTLAQVLGEASIGAITFDDSMTVTASLSALRVSPRVLSAVIYSGNQPFAWYAKGSTAKELPAGLPATPGSAGVVYQGDVVVITEIIESEGTRVGAITLRVDMSEVEAIVTDAITLALLVIVIVSVIAASLAYAVQLSIVKPVNNVVRALRDISEGEGDLTRRLPVTGTDEI